MNAMDNLAVKKAETYSSELPWNQRDVNRLGTTIMDYMEEHEPFFKRWSEVWYNNFQFIYGNQAVRWSRRYGYAVDVDFLQRLPAMNQRAQTNLARVVAEALSSMVYANLPEWDVEAADQSSVKGKRFKRIIQKFLDAMMVKLCMDVEFARAAMIYTVFGQVGAEIGWNKLGGRLVEVPKWKKAKVPVFTDYMAPNPFTQGLLEVPIQAVDSQGQPLFEDRWEPMLDQVGKQLVDKFFAGESYVDILTPFEYRRKVGSPGMHKPGYVQRILLLDYDEYLDRHQATPGRTKFYDSVQPVYSNPAIYRLAVRHFMRMQFTTPPGFNEMTRPENVYRSGLLRNKVLVVEHYDQPHPVKWPLGRKVVVCNGDATHVTVPQYNSKELGGWHPFVEAQWMNVAPSSLSAGPLNDVVAKNRELNVADSLIATMMRRNFGSQLLIKTGGGVDPQRFTGEPGIAHEVPDPYAVRWLHDDMPLPPALPELRKSYKEDVYESSGAGDALRGDRSPGAPSGYAQRIIQEREEKRLSPPRKTFEKFGAGIGKKLWVCTKSNAVDLGDDVIGYMLRMAAGEFKPQDVISLLASPMDFGVEVNVETDSMHLRSKATIQATLADMAQSNPAVQQRLGSSAKVLDQYLKFFDADELRDASGTHRDRAQMENEVFSDLLRLGPQALATGSPRVLFEDDDDIHAEEHTEFLIQNADEIMANEAFFLFFMQHLERHRLQKQEKLGQLSPGTSLQVPTMSAAARKAPLPTVSTIYQQGIMRQQQQQQQQAAAAAAGPKGPQGPKAPPQIGSGGPPQTLTSTPAANTPAGQRGGPPQ